MLETNNDLRSVVSKLFEQVERLRQEVSQLKAQKRIESPKEEHIERTIEDIDPEALADLFSVFSSPERISILRILYKSDRYFSEFEAILDIGPSSLRHHLSKLLRFNLIVQERARGKYSISSLGKKVLVYLARLYNIFRGER